MRVGRRYVYNTVLGDGLRNIIIIIKCRYFTGYVAISDFQKYCHTRKHKYGHDVEVVFSTHKMECFTEK